MSTAEHPRQFPAGYYLRRGDPRIVLLCGRCAEEADAVIPHEFLDMPDVEGHNDCRVCGCVLDEDVPCL